LSEGLQRIRIAAALLTDARGRLLLVRKRGTAWFMQPGGKIEPGEQPFDALALPGKVQALLDAR